MKLCFCCGNKFNASDWTCPVCHAAPTQLNGYPAFAPNLAISNEGYDPGYYEALAPLEVSNFWFRSRNKLIIWAIRRYFGLPASFLEIGCGTGFVLSGIEHAFPKTTLFGSEIFSDGLYYAEQRLRRCSLFQMDARSIPFEDEFDVVGAFDVLEHIAEDDLVIRQMYKAVRNGGGIIVTVPQHRFLWSDTDVSAHHVRRYVAKELINRVVKAGFVPLRVSSFVSLLFPLMMASRMRPKSRAKYRDPLAELRIGGLANSALTKILDVEIALIRAGLSFSFGGSLLLVAGKR